MGIDNPQATRTVDATNPDKLSAVAGGAIMMQAPLADPLIAVPILKRRRPEQAPDLMHKQLLSTGRFTVEQRVHPGPGDEPIVREVVVHPGAVVILPILDEGRIVMIRNHRISVDQELWELPAGTRETGEEPIETARRELEEEAGFRAGRLSPLIEFYTSPGICTELMHAFIATDLSPVGQRLEPGERIVVETLSTAEVRRRFTAGEFRDGKTIAVLGTYFARLDSSSDTTDR